MNPVDRQISDYKADFYGPDERGKVLYVPNLNEWFAWSDITVSENKVILTGNQPFFGLGLFDNQELIIRLARAFRAAGAGKDDFQMFLDSTANRLEYHFATPEDMREGLVFLRDLQNYVQHGITKKPLATLVVTGSVAAVRTGEMAKHLRAAGYNVAYKVTDAAWQFVEAKGKYEIPPHQLEEIRTRTDTSDSAITVVAPASADHIAKLASGEVSYSGPVYVAPAMNFMMWQHPATQANVRKLIQQGVKFLGPVMGQMACNDFGYGRLAEPADIAAAVKDDNHPLHNEIKASLFTDPKIPTAVNPNPKKVLLVVHKDQTDTIPMILDLQSKGYEVKCIAAPDVNTNSFDVEVSQKHYDLNTNPPGMEHIRLPEWADVVLMTATSEKYFSEMAAGRAGSLIGCAYLASKAPVFVISNQEQPQLESHGVRVIDHYSKLEAEIATAKKPLAGKHYLILGGTPRERVDSFRFYANNARPEDHAAKVAADLKAQGATVTFICPDETFAKPDGAITTLKGKKIESAEEMLEAAKLLKADFDGVLQLANISQIKCPNPVGHKISKTSAEAVNIFSTVGNVDIIGELMKHFPEKAVVGYNNYQLRSAQNQALLSPLILNDILKHSQKPELRNAEPTQSFAASVNGERKRVVITTSRTEERLSKDGVIITNGFTGRQGRELARVYADKGWEVVLISGPTNLPQLDHENIRTVNVMTMAEMLSAANREILKKTDVYISAAAIADFSVEEPLDMHKAPGEEYRLEMAENASIVGTVAKSSNRPGVVVSFAAQSPEDILAYATAKRKKLGVELTVANPIGKDTPAAKNADMNQVYLISEDGVEQLPPMLKSEVSEIIYREVEQIMQQRVPALSA